MSVPSSSVYVPASRSEDEKTAGYITDCSTCLYQTPEGCAAPEERV